MDGELSTLTGMAGLASGKNESILAAAAAEGGFLNGLLFAEARLDVQLVLGLGQALFWFFYMPWFASRVVKPFIDRSSFREQWIQLHQAIYKGSGIILSREGCYDLSCWTVPMITQHGLGGLLTIPFLLNLFSPKVNVALACHGALTEFGFELQDIVSRLWQVKYGTESQKSANNPTILKLIIAHHMVGLTLILPLNLYARDSYYYHESGFLLQGASFISLFVQQYGFSLDMAKKECALQMRNISRFATCVMLYSRVIRYIPLMYLLNMELREKGFHTMANVGAFVGLGLSFFNVVIMGSAWKKLKKFSDVDEVVASAQKRKDNQLAKSKSRSMEPESEPSAASSTVTSGRESKKDL